MNPQKSVLDFTGERMVPEKADDITFWEHIYRYRFATQFVQQKQVLDIACGEGYGTAALQKAGAASVIGVDIAEETCSHARSKYGVDARVGDAMKIPLDDRSIDVIVSFETIEHVTEPARFLDECVRVLKEDGTAVISTPNANIYGGGSGANPFHCSEMSESEFVELLEARFEVCTLYSQRARTAPWWSPRGLSADFWFWARFRGGKRLHKNLRSLISRQIKKHNTKRSRQKPIETILDRDKGLSGLANPYVVRRSKRFSNEDPMYLIAVVKSPK